jgi:hypothetical protein
MVESPPCFDFHACRDCLTTSKIRSVLSIPPQSTRTNWN